MSSSIYYGRQESKIGWVRWKREIEEKEGGKNQNF